MKVPFFDLKRNYQEQKGELDAAVAQVLGSGCYILGEACKSFEGKLKEYLVGGESGFLVACASGTDALTLALVASGIGSGDEVITVSHTALPTVAAIRIAGGTPVFVDVDPHTWLMDPEKLAAAVTPRTRAVVAVHLYGNMAPVREIRARLEKLGRRDIAVLEDAAQALGAGDGGGKAGTQGRFGAFSFYPTKNLGALGDGGAVFCAEPADAESLRMLRVYGQARRNEVRVARGFNSRLDELQAAILSVRLAKLEAWNRRRTEAMERYRRELEGLPIRFQKVSPHSRPAWHLGVVAVESAGLRERFLAFLAERGIETLIHYPIPNHRQPGWPMPAPPELPVTEALAETVVSLPCHAALRSDEQAYVIETCRAFFGGR